MQEPPPIPSQAATPPDRSGWIGRLFNGYLLAFAAGALLTLLHRLPVSGPAGTLLNFLESVAGFCAVLSAVVVTLVVCSYRQTHWRILVPALALTFWKAFYFLPLPAYFSWARLEIWSACAQALTAASILRILHRRSLGKSLLLPPEATCFARFSWPRTFLTLGAKLCFGLPALLVYVLWSAQVMVREYSAGFVEVNLSGIVTEARIYEQNGRKIYLLPTVHIASPAFYETLMDGLPEKGSVILPEGVTDAKGLIKAALDYSVAADSVGLTAQPDLTVQHKTHEVLRCDADVSDFSPGTVTVLNALGRMLQNAREGRTEAVLAAMEELEPADPATLAKDILDTRNNKVLEGLHRALPRYEHIAVPWGAAHMPGIERGVLAMKARKIESKRVEVFKWKELSLLPPL